jgi:hypothetical protein
MPLKNYSVLKGRAVDVRQGDRRGNPHAQGLAEQPGRTIVFG